MAWIETSGGGLRCDEHGTEFARSRSCPTCPPASSLSPLPGLRLGEFERLTAQARVDGLLDRLALERLMAKRIAEGVRNARYTRSRARGVLGILGATSAKEWAAAPFDPVTDDAARKWMAVADQIDNRTDKMLRAYHALVSERERIARIEGEQRQLAALGTFGPKKGSA